MAISNLRDYNLGTSVSYAVPFTGLTAGANTLYTFPTTYARYELLAVSYGHSAASGTTNYLSTFAIQCWNNTSDYYRLTDGSQTYNDNRQVMTFSDSGGAVGSYGPYQGGTFAGNFTKNFRPGDVLGCNIVIQGSVGTIQGAVYIRGYL